MENIRELEPKQVFKYFEEISNIPRGSGNMDKIAEYCMEFARKQGLRTVRDEANNVIIYKEGSLGYENSEPVILQGHLDMVCQKDKDNKIDFEKDGLSLYVEDGFLKAKGTTLGADNGIAVAMIMAILEADNIAHPPIEAVFTTDEEIGMVGALELDMTLLKGRKMLNLDAEETKRVTVSCAGGSEFEMNVPLEREKKSGTLYEIEVSGLLGGHSGIEIDSGRVNSNLLLARVLNSAKMVCDFSIVSVCGGDKGNAIPLYSKVIVVAEEKIFGDVIERIFSVVKAEISDREPGFFGTVTNKGDGEFEIIKTPDTDKLIYMLLMAPNGVTEMSVAIDGLVETSLNLGILKTEENNINLLFALRSNKKSALLALEEKLFTYAKCVPCKVSTHGHYPPWEFRENSSLQKLYQEKHMEKFGFKPEIVAIHAGLECGVFASGIEYLDCIAFGPDTFDVHTTNERLSVVSTMHTYELILEILKELK